ncbi:bactofilin family protein [Clostridium ganghwense]|uniref:Polymer-forming cytoskeletal protein n=1 Tax=Clostridium ganghwense TaxID=312089 RepID=A0ABT4CW41_9CLOT|nr:polymer-forming cytoskeletal protein [Clostridium ganghwense]MCY6372134.1 polymer-forming cytoskeletal protein [Clostridium ganghwense]
MALFSSKDNKPTKATETRSIDTIVGVETDMEGNINSNGIIKIDGKYNGEICTKTDVIIGETGFVKGNIKAENVSIAGRMEGNVRCTELLEITSTGKLIGDIEVKDISILQGAIFKGKSTMTSVYEEEIEVLDEKEMEEKKSYYLEESAQEEITQ